MSKIKITTGPITYAVVFESGCCGYDLISLHGCEAAARRHIRKIALKEYEEEKNGGWNAGRSLAYFENKYGIRSFESAGLFSNL